MSGSAMPPALSTRGLAVAAGPNLLLRDFSIEVAAGELLAVLGRNGAGKSLLLHSLAGLRDPSAGEVLLQGRPIAAMQRREIARQLGFLPQDAEPPPQVPVLEWVLGGRYAHGSEWRWPSADDERIAMDALRRVQLESLAQRWLPTLSGGEQRRAAMATLLAQQPAVMLLDEPTNHLDPRQIAGVMQLAREACQAGAAVIVTLHDPQLANRWADRALLLPGDGSWEVGAAQDLLHAPALTRLYGTPFSEIRSDGRSVLLQD